MRKSSFRKTSRWNGPRLLYTIIKNNNKNDNKNKDRKAFKEFILSETFFYLFI